MPAVLVKADFICLSKLTDDHNQGCFQTKQGLKTVQNTASGLIYELRIMKALIDNSRIKNNHHIKSNYKRR